MQQHPYRSTDPATGAITASFETVPDIEPVLQRAWSGFLGWRSLSVHERAEGLRRAGELFGRRGGELAAVMRSEMGKPLSEGIAEALYCQAIFEYYADLGPGLLADERLTTSAPGRAVLQTRPLGPLLGVMPWNYPCYQVARLLAPNLLVGNAVVIKHAESTPRSALALAELLDDAGLTPGVYQNVFATHAQVAALIADDRIRGVSLTGSERAGAAVAATSGRHLKKCVLELGGSDPFVVLDADDVDAIADLAWETRMYNNGQSCNSNKRMIVHADLHDRFVARLEERARTAAGVDGEAVPMASRSAAESLAAQVATAVADGARLVGGELGDGPAAFFAPAVLSGVTPGMRVHRQELFGPVAVVYRVESDAQAVEIANDSDYGLGGAVFSRDGRRAAAVADALDVGMVSINSAGADGPELPFGGVKRSGFGRELGAAGLGEFVNRRLFHQA